MPAQFQIVPHHVRRGLRRLYLCIAVPWIIWFGVQVVNIIDRYYWRWQQVEHPFLMMLLIPVGGPIFYTIATWIVAGFLNVAPSINHKEIIERSIAELDVNNVLARQQIYESRLTALLETMQLQSPLLSDARIEYEKKSFIAVARKIEKAESAQEKFRARRLGKGSTTLLALSILLPQLWITDATCMSVYWVARAP